ncbi:MAG: hypothetical protein ACJ72W_20905 [Actinoallomurus sp.]
MQAPGEVAGGREALPRAKPAVEDGLEQLPRPGRRCWPGWCRPVSGSAAAARAIRRTGALMAAACAVYALSGAGLGVVATVAVLVVAALLQVFGEMMQGAGGWELSFALAPEGRHGQYQGFYGMAPQCARMAGPLVLTTLLLGWGGPGWLVLGGAFLLAGSAVGPVVRYAERARMHTAPVDNPARSRPAKAV